MVALQSLLREKGIEMQVEYPLAPHTTFRVGGRARIALFPHTREQLLTALRIVREQNARYTVLGNASNVVLSDSGFDGVVIFTGGCRALSLAESRIYADCGVLLGRIASLAYENALGGAEFMHGIPGTVGGSVLMNAGAFGGCMADVCVRSDYWDAQTGEIGSFIASEQSFEPRTSIYEKTFPRYVILGAELSFRSSDRTAIRAAMEEYMTRRRRTQPLEYPSAGSVFKRPVGHYAGKLIEDCGLKGLTVGGAQVSQKHAGFIINMGGATAEDIRTLVKKVQQTVFDTTGVELETEIRFIE